PSAWVMKPNPFSGLNHLTVPVLTSCSLLPRPTRALPLLGVGSGPRAVRELLQALVATAEPSPVSIPESGPCHLGRPQPSGGGVAPLLARTQNGAAPTGWRR